MRRSCPSPPSSSFFFMATASTEISTLSLHDALPICVAYRQLVPEGTTILTSGLGGVLPRRPDVDRKSTRLNSSHITISYAGFCLKKKNRETRFCWPERAERDAVDVAACRRARCGCWE